MPRHVARGQRGGDLVRAGLKPIVPAIRVFGISRHDVDAHTKCGHATMKRLFQDHGLIFRNARNVAE
jgi:hypothetical protein